MGWLGDDRVEPGTWSRFRATPKATSRPTIMLLGSSDFSARLAGQLGLGFAFAHHFDLPGTLEALSIYRDAFVPSPDLAEPYTMVTAGVLAADDDEEAEYLAGPARLAVLGIRTNRRTPLLPPAEAAAHPDIEVARSMPSNRIVGGPATVARRDRRPDRPHRRRRADGVDDDARPPRAHPHPRARRRALAVLTVRLTPVTDLADELALAQELAARADALTLPAFEQRRFTLDWKANHTEVTEIDRGVEAMIAATLDEARPDHGRLGEEYGVAGRADSPWRWIIDPIDGTSGLRRAASRSGPR